MCPPKAKKEQTVWAWRAFALAQNQMLRRQSAGTVFIVRVLRAIEPNCKPVYNGNHFKPRGVAAPPEPLRL